MFDPALAARKDTLRRRPTAAKCALSRGFELCTIGYLAVVAENTILWAIGVKSDTEPLLPHPFWSQNFVAKYTNWAQLGVKSDIAYGFITARRSRPCRFDAEPATACTFGAAGVRAVEGL
ncbi:MAG: hypothetical protein Q4A92_11695 [Corynebacterium sp.]|nr:hypothetical protein [Corynebacterium sp.]